MPVETRDFSSKNPLADYVRPVDRVTGMTELHIAVGDNRLDLVRSLVERGAWFFPDKEGRWPSTIALICEVDEELIDYITQEEDRALREGRAPEQEPDTDQSHGR